MADAYAKTLRKNKYEHSDKQREQLRAREKYSGWLKHIGIAVAWCFKVWPSADKKKRTRRGSIKIGKGQCGDHAMQPITGGGYECSQCLRQAWTQRGWARTSRVPCEGAIQARAHHSHSLHATRGLLWCLRCGAHTSRMPRALKEECVGHPRSGAYKNVIQRLAKGQLPIEGHERETAAKGEMRKRPWDEHDHKEDHPRKRSRCRPNRESNTRRQDSPQRADESGDVPQMTSNAMRRLRQAAIEEITERRVRIRAKRRRTHEDEKHICSKMCEMLLKQPWTARIRVNTVAAAVQRRCDERRTKARC